MMIVAVCFFSAGTTSAALGAILLRSCAASAESGRLQTRELMVRDIGIGEGFGEQKEEDVRRPNDVLQAIPVVVACKSRCPVQTQ
jgi:hypothetical protein